MKNRDKYITWVNEYDMLIKIQTAMATGICNCVIDALTGIIHPCKYEKNGQKNIIDCDKCIREWLNKEV